MLNMPNHISNIPMDEKSLACLSFITTLAASKDPVIIGLSGIPGIGKTTLVKHLAQHLEENWGLETLVFSIDDFYLPYEQQRELARDYPQNKLLQYRGDPGTHDIPLLTEVLQTLADGKECFIPAYDKSAHHGRGDRIPENFWKRVNQPGKRVIRVVIFEGWCLGYRALSNTEVEEKWKGSSRTLKKHDLEHLLFVNEKLRELEVVYCYFDAFIYIDAMDPNWAYDWREESENVLRLTKGPESAMSQAQVVEFVDGYFPAYELYAENLRKGVFRESEDKADKQLWLEVGEDRQVVKITRI